MKHTLFALFSMATVAMGTQGTIDALNLTLDDMYLGKNLALGMTTVTNVEATRGKDCIVTALFTHKSAWDQQIPHDNRSYIGIEREHSGHADIAWSCAGGYAGNRDQEGNLEEIVFNRAKPESKIDTALVNDCEATPYYVLEGTAVTLQQIDNYLVAGNDVACSILRTPSPDSKDMLAISVKFSDGTIQDYVVACEVASSGDEVGIAEFGIDPQRFTSGYAFIGTEYGKDDIIAANHYMLTGEMPTPTPEPTTATLSLMALAALASRRKRQ